MKKETKCHVCGEPLLFGSSYSIRFTPQGKEEVTCDGCDVDLHVSQKEKEE